MVVQGSHSLEVNEKLLEIKGNLDILGFDHFSEFSSTRTQGQLDKNDDSIDYADVDERWNYADLLYAAENSNVSKSSK